MTEQELELLPIQKPDDDGLITDGVGVRTMMLTSYDIPRAFYEGMPRWSAAHHVRKLGAILWYADYIGFTTRKKRTAVDINDLVMRWKTTVVRLATAHDKDSADRAEAAVEECLTPVLSLPIKQVRELAAKLGNALESDPAVPFLVWRAFRVWESQMKSAPDEDIKVLKTELAKEIVDMVKEDVKAQIADAMIRALQWRLGRDAGRGQTGDPGREGGWPQRSVQGPRELHVPRSWRNGRRAEDLRSGMRMNDWPITDRLGNPLRSGDAVLSYNLMAEGETIEAVREHGKRGVKAVFSIDENGSMWVTAAEGKRQGSTGCDPSHPRYGVEKLESQKESRCQH